MAGEVVEAAPSASRIEAIDFVRGVALFGILLMNITGAGMPDAYSDPTVWGGSTGADLWAWIVVQLGFEGTQRALFSMLFGAGVILFTSRLEAKGQTGVASLWMRRTLILVGFGLFNAYVLLWAGDILFHYGLAGLLLFFFRGLDGRVLIGGGAALLVLGIFWNLSDTNQTLAMHDRYTAAMSARAEGAILSATQTEAVEAWDARVKDYKPPREELARKVEEIRSGYVSAYPHMAREGYEWHVYGLTRYPHDIVGMMLIGMGLFRLGVLTGERSRRFYAGLALGGYAVGLAVNGSEVEWIVRNGFSVVAFAQAEITYDIGRLAMTVGHLGALLWLVRAGLFPRLRRAMAAVGQMALTNYLMHSVLCGIFFIGLGFYGRLARHELYYVVFAVWALQIVVSPWWLRHFRFGPAEWLWRALTYGARPALRRTGTVPARAGQPAE